MDIYNDTDTPEQLHWHGQMVPTDVDGAAEEGTPFVPAQGKGESCSRPGPQAFAFTTRTTGRAPILPPEPTRGKWRQCTSSRRHSFELTRLAGMATAGVMKDVVMLGGYQEIEFDFVADDPGLTLFHCHQQLHIDFGFMTLFDYV